jgi:hypothetical protein
MKEKHYPARALAAYYRELARHHRASLPIKNLLSHIGDETTAARASVLVCNGSHLLAVYRVKPDGPLRRLKRWPHELDQRTS